MSFPFSVEARDDQSGADSSWSFRSGIPSWLEEFEDTRESRFLLDFRDGTGDFGAADSTGECGIDLKSSLLPTRVRESVRFGGSGGSSSSETSDLLLKDTD
jgi:hypothetical protein